MSYSPNYEVLIEKTAAQTVYANDLYMVSPNCPDDRRAVVERLAAEIRNKVEDSLDAITAGFSNREVYAFWGAVHDRMMQIEDGRREKARRLAYMRRYRAMQQKMTALTH